MEASGAALFADADDAPPGAPGRYERHRPEHTLLYQVVAQHYPAFLARLSAERCTLPRYVQREFEAYLKCGLLEHGFMRVCCPWASYRRRAAPGRLGRSVRVAVWTTA
jgi:hypothetical protein